MMVDKNTWLFKHTDVSFHFRLNQKRKLRWKMKLVSRKDLQITPLILKYVLLPHYNYLQTNLVYIQRLILTLRFAIFGI